MSTELAPPPLTGIATLDRWLNRLWKRITSTTSEELGLGTMADQDADAVDITGGTADFTGYSSSVKSVPGGFYEAFHFENSASAQAGNQVAMSLSPYSGAANYWYFGVIQNSATASDSTFRITQNGINTIFSFTGTSVSIAGTLDVTGKFGYGTGSGGTVTQGTSRTTGVTLNKTNGAITLVSAAGSATWQSFTLTNSTIAATDTIRVCQKSGTDLYQIHVTAVAAGSCKITYATTGGTTTEQPVFNFTVIKGATS